MRGTIGLLVLAAIGCGIALALGAERTGWMIAEGKWRDGGQWQ